MTTTSFFPQLSAHELKAHQLQGLQWTLQHCYLNCAAYKQKFDQAGLKPSDLQSLEDLRHFPLTSVEDLRAGYPLPLLSVPKRDVVRVHASSGTTGKRKVLAYTQADIDTWKNMMARCFELAGLSPEQIVQIAVGYGLWTAGVGFQLGCEHFGAMAIPLGPGNMDFHLQFLQDMQPDCLCSTASMALLLAEQVAKKDIPCSFKKLIFGAEPHTPKMRQRIHELLGLEDSFDISGMTELYGPGAGLECKAHQGIHYWADIYILEILDPVSLQPVPEGEVGEMVVTTLCKQAAPLIRYRTRDLTRLIPGKCDCGLELPRHDRILGRSDDMFIFRGVNVYPGQIADALEEFDEVGGEYQIHLTRENGLDMMFINVERKEGHSSDLDQNLQEAISSKIRNKILIRTEVKVLDPRGLPRTFGKSKRVVGQLPLLNQ